MKKCLPSLTIPRINYNIKALRIEIILNKKWDAWKDMGKENFYLLVKVYINSVIENNIMDFPQKVDKCILSSLSLLHYFETYIGLYSALFILSLTISTKWVRITGNSQKIITILNLGVYNFYAYSMTLYVINPQACIWSCKELPFWIHFKHLIFLKPPIPLLLCYQKLLI